MKRFPGFRALAISALLVTTVILCCFLMVEDVQAVFVRCDEPCPLSPTFQACGTGTASNCNDAYVAASVAMDQSASTTCGGRVYCKYTTTIGPCTQSGSQFTVTVCGWFACKSCFPMGG